MIRSLDHADEETIQMLAEFGLASFSAQGLENEMQMLLQIASVRGGSFPTIEEALRAVEKHGLISMGTVLAKLSPFITIDVKVALAAAVEKRNYLAHQFVRSHQSAFLGVEESAAMLRECQNATLEFQRLASLLRSVVLSELDLIGEDPDSCIPGLSDRISELMQNPEQ